MQLETILEGAIGSVDAAVASKYMPRNVYVVDLLGHNCMVALVLSSS
jgi:hypothetical protein